MLISATLLRAVSPERWQSAPFNDHWTASVFVSQDPVAIESVATDFFAAEETVDLMVGQVDNYLHEAASAHQPPSDICYAPARDGLRLASLGLDGAMDPLLSAQFIVTDNYGTRSRTTFWMDRHTHAHWREEGFDSEGSPIHERREQFNLRETR